MSAILQRRQEGQPKAVREIAWRAQLRLAQRYRHLSARKLALNKICVAIARELSAFVWDIARQVKPSAPETQQPPHPSQPGGHSPSIIITTEPTTHGSRDARAPMRGILERTMWASA